MLKSRRLIKIFPFQERITVADEIFIDNIPDNNIPDIIKKINKILKLNYVSYYKLKGNKSLKYQFTSKLS